MRKLKISVIILSYNNWKLTQQCVESVRKEMYPHKEIIIVDNGSVDNTFSLLSKKYSSSKNVTVIRLSKNKNYTGGFNAGFARARGEKIIFLSNDVIGEKNWIAKLTDVNLPHEALLQPQIKFYYDRKTVDNTGGQYIFPGFGVGIKRKPKTPYAEIDYISGTTFLMSKKLFNKTGKFDEWYGSHYEDIDLSLRAKSLGARCYCVRDSIVYHKVSQTLRKEPPAKLSFDVRKNRVRTVVKNYKGIQKILRLGVLFIVYLVQTVIELSPSTLYAFWVALM